MQAETTPGRVALLRDRKMWWGEPSGRAVAARPDASPYHAAAAARRDASPHHAAATERGPPAWGAAILAAHWDNGRLARYDPPYLIRNIVPAW